MGTMYIMFPQFPKSANVAGDQFGQKTVNTEADIGPKVFQIIPYECNDFI